MGFDDIFIKVMLESIIPPLAFIKWYCKQHWEKTAGIPKENLERLNKFERIVTPIRYIDRQEDHAEIQHELMLKYNLEALQKEYAKLQHELTLKGETEILKTHRLTILEDKIDKLKEQLKSYNPHDKRYWEPDEL